MKSGIKLTFLECKRCGHSWIPRSINKPKVCPNCKSLGWDKPRKRAKDRDSWFLDKEVKKNERKEYEERSKEAGVKN